MCQKQGKLEHAGTLGSQVGLDQSASELFLEVITGRIRQIDDLTACKTSAVIVTVLHRMPM